MKTISFTLALLMQSRRPNWLVWGAAGFALLIGLTLLVYFVTRMRKGDTEVEDDWGLGKGSLLGEGKRTSARTREGSAPRPRPEKPPAPTDLSPAVERHQHPVISDTPVSQPGVVTTPSIPERDDPPVATEPEAAPDVVSVEQPVLDEKVFAELEANTASRQGESEPQAQVPPPRPTRESFEPPKVEPVAPTRERYEPPAIVPIVPRQTGSLDRDRRQPAPVQRQPQPMSKPAMSAAGSSLGAATSRESVRLAAPSSRIAGAQGIRSLSNYGKPAEDDTKSYAGTITLVIVVLVVAGGVLSYLYVPRFHGWVDNLKMKARGDAPPPPPAESQPKVKLFPQRPQVEKNQVKAWGYVYNNSNEVLTNLSVELSLTRSDGTTESVTAPVTPSEVQPGQQGYSGRASYEFLYDGKKYTGYKVVRVLSNGAEVSYVAANAGS